MSESEDDENFGRFNFEDILTELQIISIPKLKKKMTFFFLIRFCVLCPEIRRGRKVSRICKEQCCNEHGTEYGVSQIRYLSSA